MKGYFFDKFIAPTKGGGQSWSSYWATRFPSGLTATTAGDNQINLGWTNNGSGWDLISIEQSVEFGHTWAEIDTALATATSYNNIGLTAGTRYWYRIRYKKSTSYSSYSNEANDLTTIAAIIVDGNTWGDFDFLDTTKITKGVDNLVTQVDDQLGEASRALKGSTFDIYKPLYTTDGMSFNSASEDDWLRHDTGLILNQPTYLYLVFKQVSWTNVKYILDGRTDATGMLFQGNAGTAVAPNLRCYAGSFSDTMPYTRLDRYFIFKMFFNGANSKMQADDLPAITGNFGAGNMGGLYISSRLASNGANTMWKRCLVRTNIANEADIYRYLKAKYFNGSYKLVFDGDSLTLGVGSTVNYDYPESLARKFDDEDAISIRVENYGIDGQTIAQMEADAAVQIDVLFAVGEKTLCVWGGRNDLLDLGLSKEDCYARIKTYCTNRKTAGWYVYALTMLPSAMGTRATFEADRVWINGQINTDLVSEIDGVIDIASDPDLDDNTDGTYYDADQIHLTNAGYGKVSDLVYEEIETNVKANRIV